MSKQRGVIPACAIFLLIVAGCGQQNMAGNPELSRTERTGNQRIGYRTVEDLIYVADLLTNVGIYRASAPKKGAVGYISNGVLFPNGIFIDSSGALYVPNAEESGHDTVTMYPKGSSAPLRTYRGMVYAVDVVVGKDGTVYVADSDAQRVIEFAPGTTKQLRVLHPGGFTATLGLDSKNNLYVGYFTHANSSYECQIKRYAPGATQGRDVLPPQTVFSIGFIRFDSKGAMLVANQYPPGIDVFTSDRRPPARTLNTGQSTPYGITFSARMDTIYVTSPYITDARSLRYMKQSVFGPKLPNTVVALSYPQGKLQHVWREPNWIPTGIATLPSVPH